MNVKLRPVDKTADKMTQPVRQMTTPQAEFKKENIAKSLWSLC